MPELQTPRRAISTDTAINITSSQTLLSQKAATLASNSLALFLGRSLIQATDLTLAVQAGGLSYRSPHYYTGTNVDPTEDGQTANDISGPPGGDGNKTAVDWAGKGCYDSQGKKIYWASTGAFGAVASTPINKLTTYDETSAAWSAERGFAPGGETTSDNGSGHHYDGNCIDVTGRRFFKKKFAREAYVRDLTNGSWSKFSWSSGEPSAYGQDGGMEWIPSRNRLWVRSIYSANDSSMLMELTTTGGVTPLLHSGQIGADNAPSVCSLNPRAKGGVGRVFIGGTNGYIVDVDNLALQTSTGKPALASNMNWANNAHLCRDPVGNGWIYACRDGYLYNISETGVWTQKIQLPQEIRNDYANNGRFDFVMVPIDLVAGEYGVVWIVGGQTQLGQNRAWLYKP